MIGWAVIIFVAALIAGALGLSGVASLGLNVAYLFFLVGLVLVIIHAIAGRRQPIV